MNFFCSKGLESCKIQEKRVALGYASSNFSPSFLSASQLDSIQLKILVTFAAKNKATTAHQFQHFAGCLTRTDFAVRLIVQPLKEIIFNLIYIGGLTQTMLCSVAFSLVNQFLAMKHPLKYKHDLVTKAHIIMASGLAWICALIILNTNKDFVAVISSEVFIHVVMYKEVR